MSDKNTSKKAASNSLDVLKDGRTAKDSKTTAGSALSQADNNSHKTTGDKAAEKSSKVLQDEGTGGKSKTAAGNALSQTKNKNGKTETK
jgi:hypothetical protein